MSQLFTLKIQNITNMLPELSNLSFLFLFKIIIILSLLIFNIYLYFTVEDHTTNSEFKSLESGFGGKSLRKYFTTFLGLGGLFGTQWAIKSEAPSSTTTSTAPYAKGSSAVEEIRDESRAEIQAEIEKLKAESQKSMIPDELDYLSKINLKIENKKTQLKEINEALQKAISKAQLETDESQTNVEKGIDSLDYETKIYNLFSAIIEQFEHLDNYSKIAVSMLLLKSTLISALVSIVFIFYGDYLINKYNIETRFPKLAKIILLRRKFSRYYLLWNSALVLFLILIEIIFYISILLM
uniref:hypothetical protein n=1 Tax=Singerocybe alboinfundibuliformis TaxID=1346812 RepID=UPI0030FF2D46